MKLLLDQNLSYKLCPMLMGEFPHSAHVRQLNLDQASDQEIWNFAKENHFIIVTQDSDFNILSTILKFPPYIIWIKSGNKQSKEILKKIQKNAKKIKTLIKSQKTGIIEIT